MKVAVIFGVLLAATLVSTGCGSGDGGTVQTSTTPAGATKEAADAKNGNPTAKGLSQNDLTPPPSTGGSQFGAKTGGK